MRWRSVETVHDRRSLWRENPGVALANVCSRPGGSRRPYVCGKSPKDLAFAGACGRGARNDFGHHAVGFLSDRFIYRRPWRGTSGIAVRVLHMLRKLDLKGPWRSLDIDFWPDELPAGGRTVVYGHNGSGKSTLSELLLSLS